MKEKQIIEVFDGYRKIGTIEVEVKPDESLAYVTLNKSWVAPMVAVIPEDKNYPIKRYGNVLRIEVLIDNFDEWKKLRGIK